MNLRPAAGAALTSRRGAVALLLVLQAAYLVFMLAFGRFIAGDEIAY